jgi:hypothetical protein
VTLRGCCSGLPRAMAQLQMASRQLLLGVVGAVPGPQLPCAPTPVQQQQRWQQQQRRRRALVLRHIQSHLEWLLAAHLDVIDAWQQHRH